MSRVYRPGEVVRGVRSKHLYTVISGPHHEEDAARYLLRQHDGDRRHFLLEQGLITPPTPPQKGDRGRMGPGSDPMEIHYIDNEVALLRWYAGSRDFINFTRPAFDGRWRPDAD
jgi:hypothetical protein